MDKIDTIINSTESSSIFFNFLLNSFEQKNGSNEITDPKVYNLIKFNIVKLILLSSKEDLVEKDGKFFTNKIFDDELEKSVSFIAKLNDNNKYQIDGVEFENPATLIATLKNKIAHGKYIIESNTIYMYINEKKIHININTLVPFVINSLKKILERVTNTEFKREYIVNTKNIKNRTKALNTKTDIKNYINNLKKITITLSKKDNSLINKRIVTQLNELIEDYKKTNDIKKLKIFEDNIPSEYSYNREERKIKIEDDELITGLLNETKEMSYDIQKRYIGEEIYSKLLNRTKLNELIALYNNFLLIDNVSKTKSIDFQKLNDSFYEKYNSKMFNRLNMIMALISIFDSLMIYGLETTYKDKNKFQSKEYNGLDFSKLKLENFKIEKIKIDTGYIDNLKKEYDKKIKLVQKKENKITKYINSLNNFYLLSEKEIIKKELNKEKCELEKLKEEILELNNKQQVAIIYYNNNEKILYNEAILTGIRNCLSHGDYYITNDKIETKSKIVFENRYNGEITFKASISIQELCDLIDINREIIYEYLRNIQKKIKKDK